jgi:hypothetical protein
MKIGRSDVATPGTLNEGWAPSTGIVSGAFPLNLDNIGAQIGQDLSGPGSGQDAGKLKDTEAR